MTIKEAYEIAKKELGAEGGILCMHEFRRHYNILTGINSVLINSGSYVMSKRTGKIKWMYMSELLKKEPLGPILSYNVKDLERL